MRNRRRSRGAEFARSTSIADLAGIDLSPEIAEQSAHLTKLADYFRDVAEACHRSDERRLFLDAAKAADTFVARLQALPTPKGAGGR